MKRKVRNLIKEEKEEKDSLFNEIKFKSQAAMEYLMTYGWAILIIALTLAVLYSLGIMNPKNFLPRSPPGSCFVFRPNGPGTTDFVSLQGTCGYLPMYVASFDGKSGTYVRIPSFTFGQRFTITFWVKASPKYSAHTSYELAIGHSGGWDGTLSLTLEDTFFGIFRIFNTSGGQYALGVNNLYDENQWTFITLFYDGQYMKVYKNGNIVGSKTASITLRTPTNNLQLFEHGSGTQNVTMLGGNVQVYNTALTDQEIQYLYQQGLGGGPIRLQNLVGWWPLNGDAKDYSGNNNNGIIYGGVTFVQNYNPP